MSYLENKKILLTGACGGFGTEFTRQLLEKGAHLILADIDRDVILSREVPKGVPGDVICAAGADLSTFEGCKTLFEQVMKNVGTPDIVINNAGMLTYGKFHETPPESFYKLMQVNSIAPMHLTSLFAKDMVNQRKGHFVFLSSVAGFIPTAYETTYSVSKFAVRSFGMALGKELKEYGIPVTNIYPFWADTNILNSPSYGSVRAKRVPSLFVDPPETVVSDAIKGIEKKKMHVYPGKFPRITWWANKIWPIIGAQPVQKKP